MNRANWKRIKDFGGDSPKLTFANMVNQFGYFKLPSKLRQEVLGKKYHKGFEVRISCFEDEILLVEQICKRVNIKTGKPYKKSLNRFIVPIYGAVNFYRILELIPEKKEILEKRWS